MSTTHCPECRRSIPQSAPGGLCPECLLKQGLASPPRGSGLLDITTPRGTRSIPLSAEYVANFFPHLEILGLLGQGGMGTVFKARQRKLDRLVAIKIIRPETAEDPAFEERFMREARTLARLNHPSIVAVHDFGEIPLAEAASGENESRKSSGSGRLYYFVMEYVDGANLRQLMQTGQLSPDLTLSIVPQVCEALQYAHDEGVVHRDIKPENILLDSRGRVRIADFGLAKLADPSADEWTLTGTHQVLGTPRYMAPEQLSGSKDVDHRADIYSLAVIFYEMLTGTIPVGHFSPPSQKSRVDVRLDNLILKALASEPERRHQSVRELGAQLAEIVATPARRGHEQPTGSSSIGGGFSTIIDREILGAWRMIAGERVSPAGQQAVVPRGRTPILLLLALCLVGCVSIFLPWCEVMRSPLPTVSPLQGVVSPSVEQQLVSLLNSQSSRQSDDVGAIELTGRDTYMGVLAAGIFLVTGLMWLLIPDPFRDTGWIFGAAFLLASISLVATAMAWSEAESVASAFTVPDSELSAAIGRLTRNELNPVSVSQLATAMKAWRDGVVEIRIIPGYLIPLFCSTMMMMLSAAGIRRQVLDTQNLNTNSSRTDSVTITKKELEAGILPDVCMVTGEPTGNRVAHILEYQPRWAEAASLGGYTLGGIPGVLIHMMTTQQISLSCPISPQHQDHWSRRNIFAAVGWTIPLLAGLLGFLCGYLPFVPYGKSGVTSILTGAIGGTLLGVLVYVIPIVWMSWSLVKVQHLADGRIALKRVSSGFASEVRVRQAARAK